MGANCNVCNVGAGYKPLKYSIIRIIMIPHSCPLLRLISIFDLFTSSLCLFYCEMCRDIELPVNTSSYTRAQITAVKFLINSVHTPDSGLYDIFS